MLIDKSVIIIINFDTLVVEAIIGQYYHKHESLINFQEILDSYL